MEVGFLTWGEKNFFNRVPGIQLKSYPIYTEKYVVCATEHCDSILVSFIVTTCISACRQFVLGLDLLCM